MKNKIHYSPESRRDLDDIWDYIVSELQNRSAAERVINRIIDAVDPLKNFAKVVLAKKWLSQKEMDAIHAEVENEVKTAVDDARKDPYPADSELLHDYYVEGGVN